MEKEFVTYEAALQLVELGFDERCFAGYVNDTKELWVGYVSTEGGEQFNRDYHTIAPTFQQAFRWFRNKMDLVCYIDTHPTQKYRYCIYSSNDTYWQWGDFNTYEDAEIECIKKLIEIVKKQG